MSLSSIPRLFTKFPGQLQNKNLPNPPRLIGLLGPGIIMLAAALGSGEIFFWPGLTMKYGFIFIWPAILALYIQYILNTEFARYTITTGETAVTGFTRMWKPLGWVFMLFTTLPWVWPGWSMGGGTALSWVTGFKAENMAIISLLVIGVALSSFKVVYKTIETIQKILVCGVLIFLIFMGILLIKSSSIIALGEGLTSIPTSIPEGLELSTLLAALAFCGAGGTLNLASSNWIKDKGFGMGKYIPQIINPLSGLKQAKSGSGFFFSFTKENIQKWNLWWKLIRREQFITFFSIGLLCLLLLMLLSHSLLFGLDLDIGMNFLNTEGEIMGDRSFMSKTVFYIIVATIFFTTALGVLDHVARITSDILNTQIKKSRFLKMNLTESNYYFIVLWLMILFGIMVLTVLNIDNPPSLLSIAGSLSGIVMFLYSFLILMLNLKLEKQLKKVKSEQIGFNPFMASLWRKFILVVSILFYGGFSVSLIINLF